MQEIIFSLNVFFNNAGLWIRNNWGAILASIIAAVILGFIGKVCAYARRSKRLKKLLNENNFNDLDWGRELEKHLKVKQTMKRNFPDYSDYLLVQYGSSVEANNQLQHDYDYIVLMLGFPKKGRRYLHNKGTNGYDDIASKGNRFDIDIVYRDYLSFLYAASAGMPYENSVIANGKLIIGQQGYFQWLKNITKNHLFDRDYLIRRFQDKIITEKEEYHKCISEHQNFGHDKYYVVRSGYYLITSLLQLRRIMSFDKVFFQDDVIKLSKVRNFYNDFQNELAKNKYIMLVECLKRNKSVEEIEIDDISSLLEELEISDV